MIFDAKTDLWFLGLFYGLGVFMMIAGPLLRDRPRGLLIAGLLPLLGLLFIGIGWTTSQVRYEITQNGSLDAHGWPRAGQIARLSQIEKIEPSQDPRASQAASLDRLRIDRSNRGPIFIAVEEQNDFLDAIVSADPGLVRTRTGVVRPEPENGTINGSGEPEVIQNFGH